MRVPGAGPKPCPGMIIGEAPGAQEEREGRPFVGPSGELLMEGLELGGLSRDQVYITNVVKERPPGNRNPSREEIELALPELVGEGRDVDATYVLLLGRVAAGALFPATLARHHNRMTDLRGLTFDRGDRLWAFTWHPAATLYDASKRPEFLMDVATWASAVAKVIREGDITPPAHANHIVPIRYAP